MIAIPAIDLIDGSCVRLTEGVFDTAKVYHRDPAKQARRFAEAGASRLHVVDLDAARGQGHNRAAIEEIRRAFPGTLDVGGGVRTLEDALALKVLGVDLAVVGTVLAEEPQEVGRWAERLSGFLVGGIDARDGEVKIAGWEAGSSTLAVDLARIAADLGIVEIIYTDISRDGTMSGPNIKETEAVALASGLPVVISGGVGTEDHLRAVKEASPQGVSGVIFGKALYEGTVSLSSAIQILEQT